MMKKQPGAEADPTRIVTVLSVSPVAEDYASLQAIFERSKWELYTAVSVPTALAVMRRREIGVVICERDLRPGTWIDVLDELRLLPNAPPLIIASRLADERLWAEALNLGAYDVLAKPFERRELVRSVSLAWLHWRHQYPAPTNSVKVMRAAG
jgi:DNA-binding response OmpR family regulator